MAGDAADRRTAAAFYVGLSATQPAHISHSMTVMQHSEEPISLFLFREPDEDRLRRFEALLAQQFADRHVIALGAAKDFPSCLVNELTSFQFDEMKTWSNGISLSQSASEVLRKFARANLRGCSKHWLRKLDLPGAGGSKAEAKLFKQRIRQALEDK